MNSDETQSAVVVTAAVVGVGVVGDAEIDQDCALPAMLFRKKVLQKIKNLIVGLNERSQENTY